MTENSTETPSTPAKKSAAKKAPAKKAAAPAAEAPRERKSVTLPGLPDGFAYTKIEATGPNGATIAVEPTAGPDAKDGEFTLAFDGAGVQRSQTYPDVRAAAQGVFKAAKGIDTIVKREAAAAKAREEVFDL